MQWASAVLSVLMAAAGMPPAPADGAEASQGELSIRVHEAGRTADLPCRAWVDAEGRRYFEPSSRGATPYSRDRSFSCDGQFRIALPAGPAVVHVERGKEYFPVDREVTIRPGRTTDITVELERWIDMRQRGWYSADFHVHFGHDDLAVLEQLALADDVNLLPSFSLWNQFPRQWPAFDAFPAVRADAHHLVTLDNEEIERIGGPPFHSIGVLFIFGLETPVHVPRHGHTYPPDAALARIAKDTTPDCVIDTDKPLWGENVVTMALGLFDSVQVCHNHYHRMQTLDGGAVGWGMIGDEIEEKQHVWDDDELFLRTNMIYYRWLNCGFRLAVTGGSAMGVMAVPLGYCRTYARIDGPLTAESYLTAVRAGRTFATSGPLLTMTGDGRPLGSTIERSVEDSASIRLEARLDSIDRLDAFEFIHNGQVIHHVDLRGAVPSPVLHRMFNMEFVPQRSGWVAARTIYRAPDGHLRQAHTSPIYVTFDGKPTASKRDALYMIRWIDRLLDVSNEPERYASTEDRAEAQQLFREARSVYEKIAQRAERHWGD